jgi:phosphoketolase
MTDDAFPALDAYWRAANYLTVGQIYLREYRYVREHLEDMPEVRDWTWSEA